MSYRITTRLLAGLVLAATGLPLAAQQPAGTSCTAAVAVPPIVRVEGQTELVGDYILTCTGGTPTPAGVAVPQSNFTVFLSTNVTSRVLAGRLTEALLLIDEPGSSVNPSSQLVCGTGSTVETNPGSGVCQGITGTGTGAGVYSGSGVRANIFQGQTTGANQITWFGVPFDPPGASKTRVLRFTNLRADAFSLGSASAPSPIQAQLAVSGASSVPIANPTAVVAFVGGGGSFSTRTADNSADLNGSSVAVPLCTQGPTRVATLRFRESFASGFRPRTTAPFVDVNTSPAPASQNTPGQTYGSESGFRNGAFLDDTLHGSLSAAGLADYGTRLQARFTNVPSGVSIWVEPVNLGASATRTARLVVAEDQAFAAAKSSTTTFPLVLLPVTGGFASAVWEILGADPNAADTFDFGVYASVTCTATGSVTVQGNLAPSGRFPSSGPIPRFGNNGFSTNLLTVNTSSEARATLAIAPALLSFTFPPGATAGSAQTIRVAAPGTGQGATVFASTSAGGNWLTAVPNSVALPGSVNVTANPAGLSPGIYKGALFVSAIGAINSAEIAVTMTIRTTVSAAPFIVPSQVTFTFQPGQPPPPQKISVTASDGSGIDFLAIASTVTPKGVSWLSATQSSTTTPATVTLTVNPAGLGVGAFVSVLNFAPLTPTGGQAGLQSAGPADGIPGTQGTIVDALSAAPGPFMITPNSLSFTDSDPSSKTVTVGNTAPVAFTATPVSVPAGWLSVLPAGGTTAPTVDIGATASALNLTPKPNYAARIAVQDLAGTPNGGKADVTFSVTGASPQLRLDRDSLQVCYAGGQAPGPYLITVGSTGAPLTYTAGVTSGAGWLTATGGTTTSTSTITIDPAGLTPGDYADSVLFSAAGASSQGLSVNLTVAAATSGCLGTSSTLSLPHFAAGQAFVTDLYIVNSGNSAANYSVSFYDDNGASIPSLPTLTGSISAHGVKFYEVGTSQAELKSGSATITGDAGISVQALFRRRGSDGSYYEAAVPVSAGGSEFWIPFDATTFGGDGAQIYTGVAVANLDATQPANVSCTATDTLGNTIPNAVTVPRLNPRGHWANYLFPALTGKLGTLHCTSDRSVGSMGIRALGLNAISSLPVIGQGGAPSGKSVLPHFAIGGGFVTDLYVVNSSNSAANFTLNFYNDSGSRVTGVTDISDSVPAHGVKFYTLGSPQSAPQGGSAAITSDAGITVQALFRRLGSDSSYYEAAVPMSAGGTDFSIPFDATTFDGSAQIYTGVAITNFDATHAANVACTAQDDSGTTIPNAVTVPQLSPRGHWANYLFPALTGKVGTLHCTSDTGVGAMGVRALGLNTISSLPVTGIQSR